MKNQAGKGSKNRLRGESFKKYDECPLWNNMKRKANHNAQARKKVEEQKR